MIGVLIDKPNETYDISIAHTLNLLHNILNKIAQGEAGKSDRRFPLMRVTFIDFIFELITLFVIGTKLVVCSYGFISI